MNSLTNTHCSSSTSVGLSSPIGGAESIGNQHNVKAKEVNDSKDLDNAIVWKWKENNGTWTKYDGNISKKIENLPIGQSYQCISSGNDRTYKITKLSSTTAIQMNIITGYQREVSKEGDLNNAEVSKCPNFNAAKKILKTQFTDISSLSFDSKGDICFCLECVKSRGDLETYTRGKPPKKYAIPLGWVRFGLKTDAAKCEMNNVWKEWHVAFHGTTKEIVPKIFKAGLQLLKPGDIALGGDALGIRAGHYKQPFKRKNKYSKEEEMFDTNQIFVSPSINYSGNQIYAKWFDCADDDKGSIKVQCAFQLRIRPGSYGIGQETVGATKVIDKHFSNDELEWYTKENVGIVLHGFLLNIKDKKTTKPVPIEILDDELSA